MTPVFDALVREKLIWPFGFAEPGGMLWLDLLGDSSHAFVGDYGNHSIKLKGIGYITPGCSCRECASRLARYGL